MTSSKAKLSDLLHQNDFAEVAAKKKQQALMRQKEEQEKNAKEEAEKKELERLAALPKITDEDLKRAEETGYERGMVAGKENAEIALKAEFETNLGKMQQKLDNIPDLLKEELAHVQKQTLNFLKITLERILKDASKRYSEDILKFMLEEALTAVPEKASLVVKLSSADRFYLQEKGNDIIQNSNVKFKEDENIDRGGCIIEWENSGVDARFSNLIDELDKLVTAAHDGIAAKDIELQYKEEEAKQAQTQEQEETVKDAEAPVGHSENEEVQDSTAEDNQASTITNNPENAIEPTQNQGEQTEETSEKSDNSSEDVTSAEENKSE